MTKKKVLHYTKLTILNIVFVLLCLIGLIPILYALMISFSGSGSILSSDITSFFENMTLSNYAAVFMEMDFLNWLKNSLILSVGTMIIAMGIAVVASYSFSRYQFKGKNGILKLLLVLNAFPQILSMFAIFRLFRNVGLLNSRIGLIIVYAGSMCIFSIWNLKGYFDTIPTEIEEASKIDGANDFQLLQKIVLPLATPAIIVTAVMVLIFVWNEYMFATCFLLSEENYTLAGGLYMLQSNDYSRNWPIFSAAAIVVSIPILLVFFCIQKYMVSGLTAGGVKG